MMDLELLLRQDYVVIFLVFGNNQLLQPVQFRSVDFIFTKRNPGFGGTCNIASAYFYLTRLDIITCHVFLSGKMTTEQFFIVLRGQYAIQRMIPKPPLGRIGTERTFTTEFATDS